MSVEIGLQIHFLEALSQTSALSSLEFPQYGSSEIFTEASTPAGAENDLAVISEDFDELLELSARTDDVAEKRVCAETLVTENAATTVAMEIKKREEGVVFICANSTEYNLRRQVWWVGRGSNPRPMP